MKILLFILSILVCSPLNGQNDVVNRETFTLKLAYDSLNYFEQEIAASSYFIAENVLQIFPSEKLFVEVELDGKDIISMKTVKENLVPERTIEIAFSQEEKHTPEQIMLLEVKNPFSHILNFEVDMYRLGGQEWEKTSIVPIFPKNSNYEIWRDVIAGLVLYNWQLGELDAADQAEPIAEQVELGEEAYLNTLDWVSRNNIQLNKLPLANPDETFYTCDSVLFLQELRGDTLINWCYGWQAPVDTSDALDVMQNTDYGEKLFFREVHKSGKLNGVRLMSYAYKVENDSLFELETFYTISHDSLMNLYNLMFKDAEDEAKESFYRNLIDESSYEKFKLIYHPAIFSNGKYNGNINNDEIEIVREWNCQGKDYIELEIVNRWSGEARKNTIKFMKSYQWINYENCAGEEENCMKY